MARNRSVAGLLQREDRYLVGRRKPGGDLGGKWEFPGGKIEPDETPVQALVREFLEEFAVRITVDGPAFTAMFVHSGREFDLLSYHVSLESGDFLLLEHEEISWKTTGQILLLDFVDSDRKILEQMISAGL